MELGSNYEALLIKGKFYILKIREVLSGIQKYSNLSPQEEEFHLEFTIYHIKFDIRVELITDCEETKTGHLRFYWQDYNQEEFPWVPFHIFPTNDEGKRNELAFRMANRAISLTISGTPHVDAGFVVDGSNIDRFGRMIAELLEKAIPDAKIPIPLHLIGKHSATKKGGG